MKNRVTTIVASITAALAVAAFAAGVIGMPCAKAGAAAVGSSYRNKSSKVASPMDYGARCNGRTDDSAAFNAASTYLASIGGGEIRMPNGVTCAIDPGVSPIKLRSGVTLNMNGGTIKRIGANYTANTLENYTYGISALTMSSLTQSGGLATATTSSAHGLSVNDVVWLNGATQTGYNKMVYVVSVPSSTQFTYYVASGTVSPATGSPSLYNIIDRNVGVRNGTIEGTGTSSTGTQSHVSPGAAIYLYGVQGFVVENVRTVNTNGDGVGWRASHRGRVENVTVGAFGRNAMSPTSGLDNVLRNVNLTASSLSGASPGVYLDVEPDDASERAGFVADELRAQSVTLVDFFTAANGDFSIDAKFSNSLIGGQSPVAFKIQSSNPTMARNVVIASSTTIVDTVSTSPVHLRLSNVSGVLVDGAIDTTRAAGSPTAIEIAGGTVSGLVVRGSIRSSNGTALQVSAGATLSGGLFSGVRLNAVLGRGTMKGNVFRGATIGHITLTGAGSSGNVFDSGTRITGTRTYSGGANAGAQTFEFNSF
jgi:hypothetical protein